MFQEAKNVIVATTNTTRSLPTLKLLCGDAPIKENRNVLYSEIFDGIELDVQLVMISVLVTIGRKTCTVNVSSVRFVYVFFCLDTVIYQ